MVLAARAISNTMPFPRRVIMHLLFCTKHGSEGVLSRGITYCACWARASTGEGIRAIRGHVTADGGGGCRGRYIDSHLGTELRRLDRGV